MLQGCPAGDSARALGRGRSWRGTLGEGTGTAFCASTGIVWLYAVAWMPILDAVKVAVHRILRDVVNWGELRIAAQPA